MNTIIAVWISIMILDYSIVNCQQRINCANNPCKNGRCIDQPPTSLNGYTCMCNNGYSGLNCDQDQNVNQWESANRGWAQTQQPIINALTKQGQQSVNQNNDLLKQGFSNFNQYPSQNQPNYNSGFGQNQPNYNSGFGQNYNSGFGQNYNSGFGQNQPNYNPGIGQNQPNYNPRPTPSFNPFHPGPVSLQTSPNYNPGMGYGPNVPIYNPYDQNPYNRASCQQSPCQNGGSCLSYGTNGYRCKCPDNYSGIRCEKYSLSGQAIVAIVLGTVIPIMVIIIIIAIVVYVCCVRKTKPKFMQNNNRNNTPSQAPVPTKV